MNVLMNRNDGIQNLSTRDKTILLGRNYARKDIQHSRSEHLRYYLVKIITKTNTSKLIERISSRVRRDEDNKGSIEFFEKLSRSKELFNTITNVNLHNIPKILKEEHRESIQTRRLVSKKAKNCLFDLLI